MIITLGSESDCSRPDFFFFFNLLRQTPLNFKIEKNHDFLTNTTKMLGRNILGDRKLTTSLLLVFSISLSFPTPPDFYNLYCSILHT